MCKVRQPQPHVVIVAWQERAVSVRVIVEELELDIAPMGHDEDRGLVDQLIFRDPDCGAHDAVGPFLSVPEASSVGEQSTYRRPVLFVQPKLADHLG